MNYDRVILERQLMERCELLPWSQFVQEQIKRHINTPHPVPSNPAYYVSQLTRGTGRTTYMLVQALLDTEENLVSVIKAHTPSYENDLISQTKELQHKSGIGNFDRITPYFCLNDSKKHKYCMTAKYIVHIDHYDTDCNIAQIRYDTRGHEYEIRRY